LREAGWSGGGDKRRIHEGSRKQRIAEFLNGVVVPWTGASFREKKQLRDYMPQNKPETRPITPPPQPPTQPSPTPPISGA
jgi:hypothetical protein